MEGIFLTSLHTFLINASLSSFQPQGPYSEEKQTLESSHLFLALQRLLIIPASRSTDLHPAMLSPWLVFVGPTSLKPRQAPGAQTSQSEAKSVSTAVMWHGQGKHRSSRHLQPRQPCSSKPSLCHSPMHGVCREAATGHPGRRGHGTWSHPGQLHKKRMEGIL